MGGGYYGKGDMWGGGMGGMDMMMAAMAMSAMSGFGGKGYGGDKGKGKGKGKDHNINPLKVHICGLPEHAQESSVRATFEKFGVITEVKMMTDLNKEGKRFCFVSYADRESASTALQSENEVEGTKVDCRPATAASAEKPGDWYCPMCGDLVFAKRSSCNMCGYSAGGSKGKGKWAPY
eukprot:gnl/TRDRNA2_/TRDRNA2_132353_c0_seq2.p1 gnl/TRDRNA2_/TRDRNA2_132353_c0~~gnl/TRDRNA2_/TRDRNA2_132353_c0_seq2.p1  ORF type:complete len:178 (+),score=44.99 gnl/TRDRNA2_/TRDRNA2_132353_c0_seq2:99-632(+)